MKNTALPVAAGALWGFSFGLYCILKEAPRGGDFCLPRATYEAWSWTFGLAGYEPQLTVFIVLAWLLSVALLLVWTVRGSGLARMLQNLGGGAVVEPGELVLPMVALGGCGVVVGLMLSTVMPYMLDPRGQELCRVAGEVLVTLTAGAIVWLSRRCRYSVRKSAAVAFGGLSFGAGLGLGHLVLLPPGMWGFTVAPSADQVLTLSLAYGATAGLACGLLAGPAHGQTVKSAILGLLVVGAMWGYSTYASADARVSLVSAAHLETGFLPEETVAALRGGTSDLPAIAQSFVIPANVPRLESVLQTSHAEEARMLLAEIDLARGDWDGALARLAESNAAWLEADLLANAPVNDKTRSVAQHFLSRLVVPPGEADQLGALAIRYGLSDGIQVADPIGSELYVGLTSLQEAALPVPGSSVEGSVVLNGDRVAGLRLMLVHFHSGYGDPTVESAMPERGAVVRALRSVRSASGLDLDLRSMGFFSTTATDEHGHFRFDGLIAGSYRLLLRLPGHPEAIEADGPPAAIEVSTDQPQFACGDVQVHTR